MKLNKLFFTLVLLFLVASCASDKPDGKTEAEVLYKEAQELMDDGRYILATEKLNQLKNRFPYSFYATPSELLQADILYKQENYIEAAAAYMLFRDFHPRHEKLPYVIFRIAESYYKQLPETVDRDLEGAVEAIRFYSELKSKYPTSEYTKEADKKIKECEGMLKGKEQYVADFYYRTELWDAAVWRYLEILDIFPNDQKLRRHAMKRIVSASYYDKDYEKCILYADEYFQYLEEDGKKEVRELKNKCNKK